MKKRIIAWLLVCCILVLCGCNGQSSQLESTEAPTAATQAQETTAPTQPQEETTAPTESIEATENTEPTAPDYSQINELEPNADGIYQIHSAAGLANMAKHPDGKYELLQDVDLAGADWTPVGTESAPFTGSFDGKGFAITNLNITAGADGYTGFFGVNQGNVQELILEQVQISASAGYVGTLAGCNAGTLEDCHVSGTMKLSGDAVAGGLVGKAHTGTLTDCEAGVRMEAEASASVGLLGGELKDVALNKCKFTGPMNLKNGSLFTDLAASGKKVTYTGCLWRDNSNSSEFLSKEAQEMRSIAEQRMRAQGEVEFTVDSNISFVSHNNHYIVGETYTGVPYTNMGNSLDRFLYCFNEDGTLKDFAKTSWIADDLAELYIGTDCSGAVYWAWAAVSPSTQWQWTNNMLPIHGLGGLAVQEYKGLDTLTDTMDIYEANGNEKMAESIALAHKGDVCTTYYTDEKSATSKNHVRMLAEDPVILRDLDGKIDLSESYCIMHGQGDGSFRVSNTTWVVDKRFTLSEQLKDYYVPITNQELRDGTRPECIVTVDNDKTGKAYMTTGVVESNYRLDSVTIRIKDEAGNVVWEQTMFTGISKYATAKTNYAVRKTIREFNLAAFAAHISEMELQSGQTYTYELSAIPATGESYVLKTFSFEQ